MLRFFALAVSLDLCRLSGAIFCLFFCKRVVGSFGNGDELEILSGMSCFEYFKESLKNET